MKDGILLVVIPPIHQGCSREPAKNYLGKITNAYCQHCTDHITRCMCFRPYYVSRFEEPKDSLMKTLRRLYCSLFGHKWKKVHSFKICYRCRSSVDIEEEKKDG